jgi:hypothetical protein
MTVDLKHVGILGMKWGRRSGASTTSSSDHKSANVLKKKKLKDMSNDELKKLTARLSLEKQFKDLSKKDPSSAKKFVTEVLQGSAKQLASKYLAKSIEDGLPLLIATLSTKLKG